MLKVQAAGSLQSIQWNTATTAGTARQIPPRFLLSGNISRRPNPLDRLFVANISGFFTGQFSAGECRPAAADSIQKPPEKFNTLLFNE
jgi:hypothetical protein